VNWKDVFLRDDEAGVPALGMFFDALLAKHLFDLGVITICHRSISDCLYSSCLMQEWVRGALCQ